MKKPTDYFSEARPYDEAKDDSLLDAIEQVIAVGQSNGIDYAGVRIYWVENEQGDVVIEVEMPNNDCFQGANVRDALRKAFADSDEVDDDDDIGDEVER